MAAPEINQSRLFEWLTGEEDSRMCRDIPDDGAGRRRQRQPPAGGRIGPPR